MAMGSSLSSVLVNIYVGVLMLMNEKTILTIVLKKKEILFLCWELKCRSVYSDSCIKSLL